MLNKINEFCSIPHLSKAETFCQLKRVADYFIFTLLKQIGSSDSFSSIVRASFISVESFFLKVTLEAVFGNT